MLSLQGAVSTPTPLCCNRVDIFKARSSNAPDILLPTVFPAAHSCLASFPDSPVYCVPLLYSPQAPWMSSLEPLTPRCDMLSDGLWAPPEWNGHSHLCVLSTQHSVWPRGHLCSSLDASSVPTATPLSILSLYASPPDLKGNGCRITSTHERAPFQ